MARTSTFNSAVLNIAISIQIYALHRVSWEIIACKLVTKQALFISEFKKDFADSEPPLPHP